MFVVCITANMLLLLIYGEKIAFLSCTFMSGFKSSNPFLPLLTSITGIAFYLKLSKSLTPILANNVAVNWISNRTNFIMTHHLFAKAVANLLLYHLCKNTVSHAYLLDIEQIYSNPWYSCPNQSLGAIALVLTIAITTLFCLLFDLLQKHFNNILSRKTG